MAAASLSPERSRELELLRRRAYGPDADIVLDPAAQQRLRELEDLARGAVVGPDPVREPAAPAGGRSEGGRTAPVAAPDESVGAPATDRAATPGEPDAEPRTPRRSRRRRLPLWGVTALAGIAVGLAVGLTWPADSGPSPDLTLGIDPGGGERGSGFAENLDYWGIDEGTLVPHESYDVIRVWTALGIDGARCLLLSHDGAFLSATCAGSGLDPVLDFTVYDGISLDMEDALPVGTVIRFVGHEGSVDVWVRTPGGQRPEATSAAASRPSLA
ncbi:hypothetical protein ACFUTX_08135 [Microbacterium sp. NPDC057407]|uniref:hypothetical protein n=1 Tax=Microbacterium sp. NPDC057407 TaxID=3346120 RepID=UPI003670A2CC